MGMGRMRRMVLLTGAAAVFAASGFAPASDYASGEAGILRSATYYSDDWVVNFWNSESVNMEQELLQIAQDGFNNIILCIPWREFQPQLTPAAYNDYAWDKLERVMEAAKKQNLSVMLRVGYTWDYGCGTALSESFSPQKFLRWISHLGGFLEFYRDGGISWKNRGEPPAGKENRLSGLCQGTL